MMMYRNGKSARVLLLLTLSWLLIFDAANASFFWKSRKLVDQISPLPSPVPDRKQSDPKPKVGIDNKGDNNNSNPKVSNKSDSASPPPQAQTGNERLPPEKQPLKPPPESKQQENKREESSKADTASPPPAAKSPDKKKDDDNKENLETCDGMADNRCRDTKTLVACTLTAPTGLGEWSVLVQNEGEEPLEVNMVLPAYSEKLNRELKLPKHHSERVNISISREKNNKIILNAGNGECVLHMEPLVPEDNIFLHLPSYEKLVTPINGAYLLIFSAVAFGGTWACWMCRKRRRQDGIPYQELEMGGGSEGRLGRDVETAEGWDQGWDDDWDEDNAVKSPGGHHVRNISANGLTARSSNRDEWDNDWDD